VGLTLEENYVVRCPASKEAPLGRQTIVTTLDIPLQFEVE
jgi:hypothetical protein